MRNLKTLALFISVAFLNNFYAATWTWVGGTNTSWFTKANWNTTSGAGSPATTDDIIINAGSPNDLILTSSVTVRSLEINSGSIDLRNRTLRVTNTVSLNGGTLLNSNNGSTGTLRVDGTANLNSPTDFTIISTNSNIWIRVYGTFNFVDGVLYTSSSDYLRVENNATVSGASSDSYVEGVVRKVGNDAFTFPVGRGGVYAAITMTAPSSTSAAFDAEYFDVPYVNTTSFASGVDHVSVSEYWIFNRVSSTNSVNLTLSYHIGRSGPVNSQADLIVARWNGTQWTSHGNGGFSGAPNNGTVTSSSAITSFSPFTLGSSSTLNPLPVNLISFNAEIVNSIVKLNWKTAFEKNNKHFTIEKSTDGINWSVLTKVNGKINAESVSEYVTLDAQPTAGLQFYRLSQTDLDGKTVTFETISVNVNNPKVPNVSVYPNPSTGVLNINLQDQFEHASISITNINGQLVFENNELLNSIQTIDISELPSGIYFLNLMVDGQVTVKKITKN